MAEECLSVPPFRLLKIPVPHQQLKCWLAQSYITYRNKCDNKPLFHGCLEHMVFSISIVFLPTPILAIGLERALSSGGIPA